MITKQIRKTKKMFEVEKRIGEPIEIFLKREYLENKKSSLDISRIIGVGSWIVSSWLKKIGVKMRDQSQQRFVLNGKVIKKPSNQKLRKWYIDEKKNAVKISKVIGVSKPTVLRWLREAGIERRDLSGAGFLRYGKEVQKPTNEELRRWYVDEKKTAMKICDLAGVSKGTVLKWLKDAGIERRDVREAAFLRYGKDVRKPINEELRKLYIDEKKSSTEIGNIVGVNRTTVLLWLEQAGIPRRVDRKRAFLQYGKEIEKPSDKQLRKWYVNEKKSSADITKMVGADSSTILKWLKEAKIPRRELREARFAQYGKEVKIPSDEQLHKWYIDEKKPSTEICEIVGVSKPTVLRWLGDAEIKRRDYQESWYARKGYIYKKPSYEQLHKWYVDEKKSASEIGEIVGVDLTSVINWLREKDIPIKESLYGYKEWLQCKDGHEVRSGYERRVDDWLYLNGIPHSYDKEIMGRGKVYRYDFKVKDMYIEIWGLKGVDFYDEKTEEKIAYYEKHNLKRIDIYPDDFGKTNDWVKKLESLLRFSNPEKRKQRTLEGFS